MCCWQFISQASISNRIARSDGDGAATEAPRDTLVVRDARVRPSREAVPPPRNKLYLKVERIYDQRFVRMWEFYLASSEMAFREQNLMVFQIQLTKRQGVVPVTRDYIAREEARLRTLEGGHRPPLRLAGE